MTEQEFEKLSDEIKAKVLCLVAVYAFIRLAKKLEEGTEHD